MESMPSPIPTITADGVALCARYAFGPNRLHMCGPDMNREVLAYIGENAADAGLTNILKEFKTLYPYLEEIAAANHIRDPFDARVVEAYWIGNELLEAIAPKIFYHHMIDNLELKKRINAASFDMLTEKLRHGARMHHSFHVFNIWKRTGNLDEPHTLESMDQCRISSGLVQDVDGPTITVLRAPLIIKNEKLALGEPQKIKVTRRLEDNSLIQEVKIGDTISIHWGMPCAILTQRQATNLEKYTDASITLANQTI